MIKKIILFIQKAEFGVRGTWVISAILLLAVSLFITVEVTCRYFFNSPHDFADALVLYVMLYLVFLPCGFTELEGRHIKLDLVHVRLNPQWKRYADIFNALAIIVTCSVIAYWAWYHAAFLWNQEVWTESMVLELPEAALPFAFFLGMIMLVVAALIKMFKAFLSKPDLQEQT